MPVTIPSDAYTVNLCPNPNFTTGITGYSALPNTGIKQDTISYMGPFSLLVETDGIAAGEGVLGPSGIVPDFTDGSIQLQMLGAAGNLLVSVFANPSGISPLASIPVILTSDSAWQAVVINGIELLEDQELFISVTTQSAQITKFWIDCVQYEPESPTHAYIDGDQPFCTWSDTPGNSPSFQKWQFPTGSAGNMLMAGRTVVPVQVGEIFHLTAPTGDMVLSSNPSYVVTTVGDPAGAFDDFAFYQLTDTDPAQTYVSWNNAGTANGHTSYNRIWGTIYVPIDYETSQGALWKAGQYMAPGYQLSQLAAGQEAQFAEMQAELLPYVYGAAPSPSTFDPPRRVHTIVKPTRLNYCPNPSTAIDNTGYYLLATASGLSRSSTNSSAFSGALDHWATGFNVSAQGDGLGISISNLIVGDTYTVSAWTHTSSVGLLDIDLFCSGASGSSFQQQASYGAGGYGGGPYGGVNTDTDMDTTLWYNPVFTFTAENSTVQLQFIPQIDSGTFSTVAHVFVDAILIEAGEVAGDYFDGGFSPSSDYMWEQGGTAGLTRSYYYPRKEAASGAVTSVLTQHTPLGIFAAAPQYAIPPTQ